jgi:hypothetical protein
MKLSKRVAGTQSGSQEEVIDLGWAHHRSQRDIPRGAFFHLDVVSLHQWPGPEWKLRLPQVNPNTLTEFLAGKATYVFEVLVAADNARPRRRIEVEFDYDPNSDDPDIESVAGCLRQECRWWVMGQLDCGRVLTSNNCGA